MKPSSCSRQPLTSSLHGQDHTCCPLHVCIFPLQLSIAMTKSLPGTANHIIS